MEWRKTVSAILLSGVILISLAGCGQAENTVVTQVPSTTQQQAPSGTMQMTRPNSSMNSTMPLPSSGNFTGRRPAGNFTGERPGIPAISLASAAAKLGVTEAQLTEAINNAQSGRMDLATAAAKLGVTEAVLRQALGFSDNMTPPNGPPPTGTGVPPTPAQ
jgi:hypothetical protein